MAILIDPIRVIKGDDIDPIRVIDHHGAVTAVPANASSVFPVPNPFPIHSTTSRLSNDSSARVGKPSPCGVCVCVCVCVCVGGWGGGGGGGG